MKIPFWGRMEAFIKEMNYTPNTFLIQLGIVEILSPSTPRLVEVLRFEPHGIVQDQNLDGGTRAWHLSRSLYA